MTQPNSADPKPAGKKSWIKLHPIRTIGIIAVAVLVFILINYDSSAPNVPQQSAQADVGGSAYLRLPGVSDPSQVICLGSSVDEASQVTKLLMAKDIGGIMDMPDVFCVSNGTQVQVTDSASSMKRVEITKGVREVDDDKIYLSGWVPEEWVVKN